MTAKNYEFIGRTRKGATEKVRVEGAINYPLAEKEAKKKLVKITESRVVA